MKYLQDYTKDAQTKLYKETGTIFAFSKKQYDEKAVEGVKYVQVFSGCICPKENAKKLINRLTQIVKDGIKADLKENGKDAIIERELRNHECFYAGDISDCVEKLDEYPITKEEIKKVYNDLYCEVAEEL